MISNHGARYIHGTVNRKQWLWNLGAVCYAIKLHLQDELVVVDRTFLSELVYGEIFRGAPQYDVGARVLDRALRRHGALFVLCVPADQERQAKRWADGRAAGKTEHFSSVREVIAAYADLRLGNVARPGTGYLHQLTRFGDFASRDDVIVYDLDRDGHDLGAVSQRLLRRLAALRRATVSFYGHNLTGRVTLGQRGYLLVGETPSNLVCRWPRAPRWPFADRDTRASSANWLNQAIHRLALAEDRLELVNAIPYRDDDGDYLPEVAGRATARGDRIVALGKVASRRLIQCGAPEFRIIPHPQWHRRFRHTEGPEGYAELLREAIR